MRLAQPLWPPPLLLLLLVATIAGCLHPVHGQGSCPVGFHTECNACVCCCYGKAGIPKYKPKGCKCKAAFDSSLTLLIIMVVLTLATSIGAAWYFGGSWRQGPYRRDHLRTYAVPPELIVQPR